MSMKYFSIMYDALTQRRFEEDLEAGRLEKALEVIESLPNGMNPSEWVQRTRVLVQGYRVILEKVIDNNLVEGGELLSRYQELGSVEYLTERLEILKEYQKLGKVDRLKENLEELENYEDAADPMEPDDLRVALLELERYREVADYEELEQLKTDLRQFEIL